MLMEEVGYDNRWCFHSRCKVGEKGVDLSIDDDTSINAASVELVEKLKLETTPHPQPYRLLWYDSVVKIKTQVKVFFSLGAYSCEVACDVIPVPMVSYHMLLGRPWCRENGANMRTQSCSFV